ncbi:phospholipase D-like domain-containing protein [Corynebacterium freneyi]
MPNDYPLELGLYQALRTLGLDRRLAQMPGVQAEFTDVVESDSAETLGAYVGRVVTESLARLDSDQRKDAVNRVIASLSDDQDVIDDRAAVVSDSAGVVEELTSLRLPESPALPRPKTPLLEPALLTNSRDEPNIGEQIGAELGSADQVDILMAFVKYAGINTIKDQLRQLVERGARLRVITTTYCGATDRRAVDLLVELGAHVKIRYEKDSTRLHAKAWLFRRNTGFDTAYVGSSNLSFSAMTDGLEWNVRLTSGATSSLLAKFSATFDTYWADESFETYVPDRDGHRLATQLKAARLGASGRSGSDGEGVALLSGLEVRPRAYQRRMLEALAAEREVHDRHHNLLVAATGTGKTVVAALDYRPFRF